jgi:hypothetical protein
MLYLVDFPAQELEQLKKKFTVLSCKAIDSSSKQLINISDLKNNEFNIVIFYATSEWLKNFILRGVNIDAYFFYNRDSQKIDEIIALDPKYFGETFLDDRIGDQIMSFSRLMLREGKRRSFLEKKIFDLKIQFQELVTSLENVSEMTRVRYQGIRDKFKKNILNISVQSLYKVGLKAGSEFNELFRVNDKIYWVCFSTDSYETSADLISGLEQWLKAKSDLAGLLKVFGEIRSVNKVSSFVLEINSASLEGRGYLSGEYNFLSTNPQNIIFENSYPFEKEFMDKCHFAINLTRDEDCLLLSPGLKSNLSPDKDFSELRDFCLDHLDKGREDLLDEILIESVQKQSEFFDHDCYISYLKVIKNAMVTV